MASWLKKWKQKWKGGSSPPKRHWIGFEKLTIQQAAEHWLGKFDSKYWITHYRAGFQDLYDAGILVPNMFMKTFAEKDLDQIIRRINNASLVNTKDWTPKARLKLFTSFIQFLDEESKTMGRVSPPTVVDINEIKAGKAEPAPTRRAGVLEPQLPKLVLVVDDIEDNRKVVRFKLRKEVAAGLIQILEADNGHEAIFLAKGHQPDLILMDMAMPGMNGYEATRELRKMNYRNPIWALTASVDPKDRFECENAGCNRILPKPVGRGFRNQVQSFLGLV